MINAGKKAIVSIHYATLISIIWLLRGLLFKKLNKQKVNNVLVFRTGSIGDNICAFPALSVICKNFPDAKIDILTNAGKQEYISLEHLIDPSQVNQVINYIGQSKKQLFVQLRRNKYDLFIELTQSKAPFLTQIRNIFIAKSLGVNYGLGWQVTRTMIFPKWQEANRTFLNERDRLLNILDTQGLKVEETQIQLDIDINSKQRVLSLLENSNITEKDKNIGVVTGANLDRKKWPIANFSETIDHLVRMGYNILMFGGGEDHEEASQLEQNTVYNFCGKLSPLESAEMMKYCSLVISNDTGPMHMAYAVGTPVIDLVSSRDYPGEWYPPDDGVNKVIRTPDVHCSICLYRKCDDNICMQAITVEMIIVAAEEILKGKQLSVNREIN